MRINLFKLLHNTCYDIRSKLIRQIKVTPDMDLPSNKYGFLFSSLQIKMRSFPGVFFPFPNYYEACNELVQIWTILSLNYSTEGSGSYQFFDSSVTVSLIVDPTRQWDSFIYGWTGPVFALQLTIRSDFYLVCVFISFISTYPIYSRIRSTSYAPKSTPKSSASYTRSY